MLGTDLTRLIGASAGGLAPKPKSAEARISANFALFDSAAAHANGLFAKGELESAAVWAAIASHVATGTHCGIFFSPRLERLLNAIGRRLPAPGEFSGRRAHCGAWYKKVLHVCTEVHTSGGLTRMLSRWVNADKSRQYSLALTMHRGAIPDHVSTAIRQSGGRIYSLNRAPGGPLRWAQELQRTVRSYDAIVLHTHCEDVIPVIAFAQPELFPPVLFLNHADHLFWLGPSVSHVVINLRDAARDISAARRGVPPERNLIMPTIVDPTVRTRSREEAKRALGLEPGKTVILSVARAAKYQTFNGLTYAERHLPMLQEHPDAELIVVGAGAPPDWEPAIRACSGRIKPLPNQADPRPYYEAGDIYVDSYPFVSSTSIMEAAGYGMPAVTIFEAPKGAEIFGINHVGLVGTALVARNAKEYRSTVSKLITDVEFRARTGEATQVAVAGKHAPPGWLTYLNRVFDAAAALPPVQPATILSAGDETPAFGEPDCRHEDMLRSSYPMSEVIKGYLGMMPLGTRLRSWNELRRSNAFSSWIEAASSLPPEWMKRRLKS